MNKVAEDSAKLLTEKLALSRELHVLKPEVEHLRSQLSHHQSVVAEKLSLQRQLDSLEVELEAEKKARQRASHVEGGSDVEEELRQKLIDAEKKLSAEKKDKERIRKESERALAEATGERESLEQRLDMMKTKLHTVQDELKKCRAELARSQQSTLIISEPTETIMVPVKNPLRRKRRQNEISADDATIHTPEKLDTSANRPAKKRGLNHTLMVEKSTFSITPFLNKTVNLGASTPKSLKSPTREVGSSVEPTKEATEVQDVPEATKPTASPRQEALAQIKAKPAATETKGKPRGRRKKVFGEASTGKKNVGAVPSASKPAKASPVLENVAEEADTENQENIPAEKPAPANKKPPVFIFKGIEANSSGANSSGLEQEPKKKKRKLLGVSSTLFDDEDGEMPAKRPAKVMLGPTRRLGKTSLRAGVNAFAKNTFSPLKKVRRGVNASFLA